MHDEILISHKKGNPAICNNMMKLEDIMLKKIIQKEDYITFILSYIVKK